MKRYLILVFVLCLLVGCGSEPKAGDTRVRDADGMVMVYVPVGEFLLLRTCPGGHPFQSVQVRGHVDVRQFRRLAELRLDGSELTPQFALFPVKLLLPAD